MVGQKCKKNGCHRIPAVFVFQQFFIHFREQLDNEKLRPHKNDGLLVKLAIASLHKPLTQKPR